MKNKPHYFGFLGMIICLLADDVQDLTNINQWVFLSLGLAICFIQIQLKKYFFTQKCRMLTTFINDMNVLIFLN